MVLGFVEAVFCVWLVFLVVGSLDVLGLNAWLMSQVEQSRLLSTLYYSNYLVGLLRQVLLYLRIVTYFGSDLLILVSLFTPFQYRVKIFEKSC